LRLRRKRDNGLGFSTEVRRFIPSRIRRIFKGEKILTTPSFGGEVNSSVTFSSFAACKRSLKDAEVVISTKLLENILAHSSTFCCGRGGTWRLKCDCKSNNKNLSTNTTEWKLQKQDDAINKSREKVKTAATSCNTF
jgi:hypothetical protein